MFCFVYIFIIIKEEFITLSSHTEYFSLIFVVRFSSLFYEFYVDFLIHMCTFAKNV